jgi:hypothetical protein
MIILLYYIFGNMVIKKSIKEIDTNLVEGYYRKPLIDFNVSQLK